MNMTPRETPASHLTQEVETARLLLKVLKQEQTHLLEADVEALETLTPQKSALVSRMSAFAISRHKALAKAGLPSEEASMEKWLNNADHLQLERHAWDELVRIVQSAKELNRTNGLLINSHMARNQSALQVLQHEKPTNTYGPDGQARLGPTGRGFVTG